MKESSCLGFRTKEDGLVYQQVTTLPRDA